MIAVHPHPTPPPHDPNAGLRTAGTVAIWVWILIAAIPIVMIVGCFALCIFGGIMSELDPTDPAPAFSYPAAPGSSR
jgi:hypothetical protein